MLPKLPQLPKLSEHLPPNPLRDVVQEVRDSLTAVRTEVHAITQSLRITPQAFTEPRRTKNPQIVTKTPEIVHVKPVSVTKTEETEPGTCLPCEQMKELRETVGRRKVEKALKDLSAQGIQPANVELLRKYIQGEDVY